MNTVKKYRILSLEAESLVHSQMVGGFSAQSDGKPNVKLFTGILDYSLESERLREVCDKTRTMSKKTYFSKNGYDYTTAIINVKFKFTRHDFVKIDGIYVREGYGVSAAFSNSSEVREGADGRPYLVAIKTHRELEGPPLPDDVLGAYFAYDAVNNRYTRRKDQKGAAVPFSGVENKHSLRETLYRDGFDCDGVHYVRYKRSAGSSRTGQCLFIAEPLWGKMMKWGLCGLDQKNREAIDLASFEAYISLSLSSITDTLRIPKNAILFTKDAKSSFRTRAVSVASDGEGRLVSAEQDVDVSNAIWDGEALLDTSVFESAGYADRGMMLLRNRFFKTCAFHTNLQQYFKDHDITDVAQLCGYTQARYISDIKMIVTESSLKYLKLASGKSFERKIKTWLKYVDDVFGIVKTDKPTGFFEGQVVRTSYQLLNTLGLSEKETTALLQDTFDYYKKVRTSPTYMRNYINYTLSEGDAEDADVREDVRYFHARQKAMLGCLSRNDDFARTAVYEDFKSTVLESFSRKIRSGRLLIKGTNATIFGNGLELLAASIGRFCEGDAALALGGEGAIYCKHFATGASLLGCRSPHVTMGNLMVAQNVRVPDIDRYFKLTGEIVYVNAIGCNIQQRLNGCDYDSDAMLLTDNPLMVAAARKNASFAVPVCSVDSTKKKYADNFAGKAELDHEISQNKIGEIINLSQLLNTLYWHNTVNAPDEKEANEALYRDICILAVLSGMEIDKAKRNYDVATSSVLKRLKAKYKMDAYPEIFKFIMYTLEEKPYSGETRRYDTTMDYVFSQTLAFTRSLPKSRESALSLAHFVEKSEEGGERIKSRSNDARDCAAIKQYVAECQFRIGELRAGIGFLEADEKYLRQLEIERIYHDAIAYVSEKLKHAYMLKSLLRDIDRGLAAKTAHGKKFYWILFEMLCLEEKHLLYDVLASVRECAMSDLVQDMAGDVEIYGVKHVEKVVKNARK